MDPWGDDWQDEHDGFEPGDIVGKYELLFPAASGGMATVWAARRREAHGSGAEHIIAVKLVSDALHSDSEVRGMFLDEARTASRILHPNVVEIFACGEVRERPYIAMEWIDGESLGKIASAQKAKGALLPLSWVLHVASAACAGLHAAHEVRDDTGELLHLIHRDVTPQNVMVGFDGTVKVVDFGVAKSRAQTQVSRAGVIKGKTAYFSPEQVSGGQIDRRSDLFSFGCLLYLLVTGHPPFRGRGFLEVMSQITNKTPQSPLEIMPDLPPELDRIIMKALARDPGERYQTAAELRRDLDKVKAALGERLTKKDIGGLVSSLLPGVAAERREKIFTAAEELDLRPPKEDEEGPRPLRPEDATEVMMRSVSLLFAGSDGSPGSGPRSTRRSDPGPIRKSDPGPPRKSDPDSSRKSDPTSTGRKSDAGPPPKVITPARRSDPSSPQLGDPEDGPPSTPAGERAAVTTRTGTPPPRQAIRRKPNLGMWIAIVIVVLVAIVGAALALRT